MCVFIYSFYSLQARDKRDYSFFGVTENKNQLVPWTFQNVKCNNKWIKKKRNVLFNNRMKDIKDADNDDVLFFIGW